MKTALLLFLQLGCVALLASEPPLSRLGQPFAKPACEIVWAVTNQLQDSLWVYRVLPSTFSPRTISNLVALGSFTAKDKVANLGWPPTDVRSTCFSNAKRSLGCYSHLGFIEYRYPEANDNKTDEGVPTNEEARQFGTNYLKCLGLDFSQISKSVGVIASETHHFKHEPVFHVITNYYSREVLFGRSLDGVDFYNRAEGCRIEFDRESIASVKSNTVNPEVVK